MASEPSATFAWDSDDQRELAGADPRHTVRGRLQTPAVDIDPPPLISGPGARYTEGPLLGEGGMALVVAARDEVLQRPVAIKRPRPGLPAGAAHAILVEARTLARLDHPNIVPVYALGADAEGGLVVVMKQVVGVRWSDRWEAAPPSWGVDDPAAFDRDLDILLEVAQAVAFAHARGVLHRDIKPENVMIGEFGEVYLMDWGCACALEGATTTVIVGTPAYMAPEMASRGARLDATADVYLLGATLHAVLTGGPRHGGASIREVVERARVSASASYGPEVSAELAALVNRACAPSPADRFPSATAFADAVRRYRAHREAVSLGRVAQDRARALVAALAGEVDLGVAERLFGEVRANARAAWHLWPDCPEAVEAWEVAHEALLPRRLASGDVSWVETVVRDGRPEDVARWADSLRAAGVRRAEAQRQLEANDLAFAARERLQAMGVVLGGSLLVGGAVVSGTGFRALSGVEVARMGALGLVIVMAGFLPFRRRIFGNRASRALMTGILLIVTLSAVHRTGAWIAGADPSQTLGADAVMHTLGILLLALQLDGRLAWAAPPYALAGAVCLAVPEAAALAFPAAAITSIAAAVLVFRRRAMGEGVG